MTCSKNAENSTDAAGYVAARNTENAVDECEHEIRLVRARNDRLELEALEWMQFAQRVRRYLDEQGAVHQHVKRLELDAWLRDKGIE